MRIATEAAFERDRRRDRTHVAAGYRVIRVTWRQLQDEPLTVIASIAQALAALPARSGLKHQSALAGMLASACHTGMPCWPSWSPLRPHWR